MGTEEAKKKTTEDYARDLLLECEKVLQDDSERAMFGLKMSGSFPCFLEASMGNGIDFVDINMLPAKDIPALARGMIDRLRKHRYQMRVDWSNIELQREIHSELLDLAQGIFGKERGEFLDSQSRKEAIEKGGLGFAAQEAGMLRLTNRKLKAKIIEQVDLLNPANAKRRHNG